jgi:hypothetical protein
MIFARRFKKLADLPEPVWVVIRLEEPGETKKQK